MRQPVYAAVMTRARYRGSMVSARWVISFGGEEPLLGVLDLGQGDVATGSAGDESTVDGVVEDPSEELVGLADGGRGVPVGVKVRNPFLDVEDTDGADRHVGEDGQDEAAQIRLVTGFRRVAAVHPPRGRLLGELTESDPSGPRVDVGAGEFAGLDGDEEPFGVDTATEVLRPLDPGRGSTWKRYCDSVGVSMGRAVTMLIDRELVGVFGDVIGDEEPVFAQRATEELAIREARIAIQEREVGTEEARMRERGERLRRWEDALEAREQQAETVLKLTSRESTGRAKIGRNERCPCGSGLKYKHCHGLAGRRT